MPDTRPSQASSTSLAEIKISELPVATAANLTDQLEANQAGTTRSLTVAQVAATVAGTLPAPPTIPTTLPPSGPAGGALSGTYPNPGLAAPYPTTLPPSGAAGGALAGTYPNPTLVGGPLSNYALSSSIPTTLPPSGTAGGDLSGTYPNPTVKSAAGAFAVTGALTGTTATLSAAAGTLTTTATTNGAINLRAAGLTRGLIVTSDAVGTTISGTDNTGTGSFQPLILGGSVVNLVAPLQASTATLSAAIAPTSNDTTVPTTAWVKANAGPGSLLQTVFTETGAVATGTTLIPNDDTIPQQTEGDQYMSLAITPKSATSKLIIEVVWIGSPSTAQHIAAALFQDATANALAVAEFYQSTATGVTIISFRHIMTSGTTSSTTFKVRAGTGTAATTTFNGQSATRVYGGVMASSIVIREVA